MYASVPTQGVTTIYGGLGDAVGWLAVVGLGVLIVYSLMNRRDKTLVTSGESGDADDRREIESLVESRQA